jgi:hypothetical protein
LEKDLSITNSQYNQGLAVFYATYIARCEPVLLLHRLLMPKQRSSQQLSSKEDISKNLASIPYSAMGNHYHVYWICQKL